ncbi:hypothetical protein A2875_03445 [Candidatus Gottesmanbacteria bacterium RIFCSPHIGHO2_01_FULL_46_14]|uniref:5'-3' exonuclease domain-containing protein n=2 Tax=Candidatus Gottesmaniibacteriota TaxID=1752720 RepID=A0A1F5ZKQ2_9BACT|nr:MAG: hypothetical protein A2875_03445 [Candidatus Gottesmanbacteria bacterium RIFCSPHIGHO2_01_FULL_46_14]OGG29755.1 MAG: hypothetical protein A2971_00660 [Candidatus Gottesmanbacteria bacterium RIFCSPLOWO2_01_FULL_46_21]
MNRFVLIDGNAMLHRAYHALPPLTTPDGTLVNAVYGFTSMLIKLFGDLKPTHMAVAFDRPEPTFRKSLYKEYQAKRPEMEEGLSSQIPKVQDIVRAFGIPIYEAAGFEADDVIGTVCRKISGEVIIVTGDKDILQLVDDNRGVKVFMPTKGLSEGKVYGEKEVEEKMGVPPKLIPDLKALMGDPSDNYPGVSGIGPKTAVELIARYGSVEELYKSDALTEKLLKGKENAFLSKDLATIRTNAPVEVGELPSITTLDTPQVREKLEEFHFPSLVKRLTQGEKKLSRSKKTISQEPQNKKEEQLTLV